MNIHKIFSFSICDIHIEKLFHLNFERSSYKSWLTCSISAVCNIYNLTFKIKNSQLSISCSVIATYLSEKEFSINVSIILLKNITNTLGWTRLIMFVYIKYTIDLWMCAIRHSKICIIIDTQIFLFITDTS